MGLIGPKLNKSCWTFQIRFQNIQNKSKSVLKSDLEKSRICPIWGNMTPLVPPPPPHPKSDTPGKFTLYSVRDLREKVHNSQDCRGPVAWGCRAPVARGCL